MIATSKNSVKVESDLTRPISGSNGGGLVSKMVEAVQRSLVYVFTAPSISRKRKMTDDNNERETVAKKCKNRDTDGDNECSICLEQWCVKGDHSVVCLKCGHLFGLSCIVKWINRCHCCPLCCAEANEQDIRRIFVKKVAAIDTSQLDLVKKQLEEATAARSDLNKHLAIQKTYNNTLRRELDGLKGQITVKKGYFDTGFGISAAVTVIKNCISKNIFDVLKSKCKLIHPELAPTESENKLEEKKDQMAEPTC